jgi:hypothetical protein
MSISTDIEVTESAILIRINQYYREGMSPNALYEATRGVWVIGRNRSKADYAFSIANGIVREIFRINSWHPAGTTPYVTRSREDVYFPNRWEFLGEVAPSYIREKYLDKSVAHYFKRGAANPIMYVNSRT